jgi:hypothetical protein
MVDGPEVGHGEKGEGHERGEHAEAVRSAREVHHADGKAEGDHIDKVLLDEVSGRGSRRVQKGARQRMCVRREPILVGQVLFLSFARTCAWLTATTPERFIPVQRDFWKVGWMAM